LKVDHRSRRSDF